MIIQGKITSVYNNSCDIDFSVCLYVVLFGKTNLICCKNINLYESFFFEINNIYPDAIYYLEATTRDYIKFINVIGDIDKICLQNNTDNDCDKKSNLLVNINELTTVASVYCFNKFFDVENKIYGKYKFLNVATMMKENFVDLDGKISNVLTSNPNANETNSYKMFNTLGNLLYGCADNNSIFESLVLLTTKNIKSDTIDIFKFIVNNPINNLFKIYELAILNDYFKPNLERIFLSNWLLTIKINFTGDNNYLFGGPGNFSFDKDDNIWITNNVVQGLTTSCNFNIVLLPNGKPVKFSPIFGGGILGCGFGVDINKDNQIFFGSFGWGGINPESGAISQFIENGLPVSPSSGYTQDTFRIQGVAVDKNNNLWICSYGNDRIVVYLNCDPNNSIFLQLPEGSEPFHVQIDSENFAVASLSKSKFPTARLVKMFIKDNKINIRWSVDIGIKLLGLSIDKNDDIFVCSNLNSTIYKVNKDATNVTAFIKGSYGPWGCCVNNDYLFVANFDPNDDNLFSITQFDKCGNTISPLEGYTLLTGGDQVRLSNGMPLYGDIPIVSFNPLMRQTAIHTDSAGNVWVTNNWKPNFAIDLNINPGGDGMVVFVGLGYPKDN